MKLDEIVTTVAEASNMKRGDLKKAVNSLFEIIKTTVEKGDKVSIPGLGSFVLKSREEGEKTDPKSGEKKAVTATSFISFKASKGDGAKKAKAGKTTKPKK